MIKKSSYFTFFSANWRWCESSRKI